MMLIKKNSANSNRWLQEHFSDRYVRQAQKMGLRSRAWFKLNEIQQSDRLFRQGITVIDLGSAPGSWSQYVATEIGSTGRIIACDILPMNPIANVDFLQGDFRDYLVPQALLKQIGKQEVHVVLSDMAPNMSGASEIDIPNSIYLAERALNMCQDVLISGGSFVVKVFQGEGFNEYLNKVRSLFTKIRIRKPNASRTRSREVYIVAIGHKI